MLTLSSDAEFTSYVTPVCLWEERSDSLDDIVDKDGTVRLILTLLNLTMNYSITMV